MIESFASLLSRWTPAELADDLGVAYQTAVSMRSRNSLAPRHWPRLIEAAARRGISLDEATLMRLWLVGKPVKAKQPEAEQGAAA